MMSTSDSLDITLLLHVFNNVFDKKQIICKSIDFSHIHTEYGYTHNICRTNVVLNTILARSNSS